MDNTDPNETDIPVEATGVSSPSSVGKTANSSRLNGARGRDIDNGFGHSQSVVAREEKARTLRRVASRGGSSKPQWGMIPRFVIPVLIAVLICILVSVFFTNSQMSELFNEEIKREGGATVRALAIMGGQLIRSRDAFLASHHGYDDPGQADKDWDVADHWLVTSQNISPERWLELTRSKPGERLPRSRLDQAMREACLLSEVPWIIRSDTRVGSLDAYILDADRNVIASTDVITGGLGPISTQWSIPLDFTRLRLGGQEILLDNITIHPDYLSEKDVPALRFSIPIHGNQPDGKMLGSAVVILRLDLLKQSQWSALRNLILMGVGILVVMVIACIWAASRVAAPVDRLLRDMRLIARGDLSQRTTVSGSREVNSLAGMFNDMVERLVAAVNQERETDRMENDLSVARDIQNNLLPRQTLQVHGLDISSAYRPAKAIGGDYYDFLPVDAGRLGIIIADVSGKSVPGALVMATTRAVLRFIAPGNLSVTDTLSRANAIIGEDIPRGMFVTAFYVLIDPVMRTMVCANAGHNSLILVRADGRLETYNPGGIALGFDKGRMFQRMLREQRVTLAAGDRVVMYTDGVNEAMNVAGEEYSEKRLQEFSVSHRDLPSTEFVGSLLADIDHHRGTAEVHDDITIVTFRVT